MLFRLGVISCLFGLAGAILIYTGTAPHITNALPLNLTHYITVFAVGAVVVLLNRTPSD